METDTYVKAAASPATHTRPFDFSINSLGLAQFKDEVY